VDKPTSRIYETKIVSAIQKIEEDFYKKIKSLPYYIASVFVSSCLEHIDPETGLHSKDASTYIARFRIASRKRPYYMEAFVSMLSFEKCGVSVHLLKNIKDMNPCRTIHYQPKTDLKNAASILASIAAKSEKLWEKWIAEEPEKPASRDNSPKSEKTCGKLKEDANGDAKPAPATEKAKPISKQNGADKGCSTASAAPAPSLPKHEEHKSGYSHMPLKDPSFENKDKPNDVTISSTLKTQEILKKKEPALTSTTSTYSGAKSAC